MIALTRLNHTSIVINSDLIEQIESTPDTVITLTTSQKIMVLETTGTVVERVLDFRRSILNPDWARHQGSDGTPSQDRPHGRL
jgi:flagellar protein FlbD